MPRQQKGKKGPDALRDLKPAPLTQGEAASVKGGSMEELRMQLQLERAATSSTLLSNVMKKQSETSSAIINNLK